MPREILEMSDCPCLPGCPFFNDRMADMPTMASQLKEKFCKGDNSGCARFMIFSNLGAGKVPSNLFPTHAGRAKEILAAG